MGTLQKKGTKSGQFGDLPPKLREKILQARERGFPKGYEKMLESYYRRLAKPSATESKVRDPKKVGEGKPAPSSPASGSKKK